MLNSSPPIVVQHLLFVFLVVVAPAWDFYDTRRLRQNPGSERKLRYYRTLVSWLWIATVVAWLAVGFRPLFVFHLKPEEMPWLFAHLWVRSVVWGVLIFFIALTLL